jgi:acyl-CoA reductase-like NAD-dependent aldehyde dehydrogenase
MSSTTFEPHAFDKLFIGGKDVAAAGGALYDDIDPSREEVLGQAPDAGIADARRALEAARASFDGGVWSRASLAERARVMRQIADRIERRAAEIVELTIAEIGHPRVIATGFAATALANARYVAELAGRDFGYVAAPVVGEDRVSTRLVLREPVGVVTALLPFNAPIPVGSFKVLPAIAAGNSVVLKPSPLTPWSALWFARVVEETDLPPGVLNVITGTAVEIGRELAESPLADMVSFTGSPEVGAAIMAGAAKTIKKVVLELGGKSAQIILDDAPMPAAAAIAASGPMGLSGQGCSLPTRILVPRRIYDEFVAAACGVVARLKVGDPRDATTVLGPVVSAAQRERVERYVALAQAEGATLLSGGRRPPDLARGYFYEPTLFGNVDNRMRIAQEEVFGPVGVVIPYDDEEDALRIANESDFGLGGNILSRNPRRALALARRIRTGQVWINSPVVDAEHPLPYPDIPFGGFKRSGFGREMGVEGYLEYTEVKNIVGTF